MEIKKTLFVNMADFRRGNTRSIIAVNYNSKLNDLIRNIVSKGFSIDIVAPWYIPSSKEVEKAKTIFLRRKSDITYIFDIDAEDGWRWR